MTADGRSQRRILVALDASRASLEALAAAASLAARLGADLEGLFVEDVNLLRLAALPVARQLPLPSGSWQPLDPHAIETELAALARRAREALARAAEPHRVAWSFRVTRGNVSIEVLSAAGGADLLVLGAAGHRIGPGRGETARTAATRSPVPVLVLGRGAEVGRPVVVAVDGSAASDRALALAARLVPDAGALRLVALAATQDAADSVLGRARLRLEREAVPGVWAGGTRLPDLLRTVSDPRALLVVAVESAAVTAVGPERLLDEARCPVLLVR